jgi:hypothetical protein
LPKLVQEVALAVQYVSYLEGADHLHRYQNCQYGFCYHYYYLEEQQAVVPRQQVFAGLEDPQTGG